MPTDAANPVLRRRQSRRQPRAVKPNVALTERDLEICAALLLHRFMKATDIARLLLPDAPKCAGCLGSGRVHDAAQGRDVHHLLCRGTGRVGHRALLDRIGTLYAGGFLTRPAMQFDYWSQGSQRLVYAIANDGVRALMRHGRVDQTIHVDHSQRAAEAAKKTILHTLAQTELSVALLLACRRRPGVKLLQAKALAAELPPETAARDFPFQLAAEITMGAKTDRAACNPDWTFALQFPTTHTSKKHAERCFLAEIDRGTEPIDRSTFNQTSVIKKLKVYDAAWRGGVADRQLDWPTFRVPIITTSSARAEGIIAAIKKHNLLRRTGATASSLFIIATFDQIAATDDILAMKWLTPTDEPYTLLPEHMTAA